MGSQAKPAQGPVVFFNSPVYAARSNALQQVCLFRLPWQGEAAGNPLHFSSKRSSQREVAISRDKSGKPECICD